MPKFLVVYRGAITPASEMPVEEHDEIMDRWGEWMERNGDVVVDPGFPFGPALAVAGDGSEPEATTLSGYSILEAESLQAALERCRDHPFLHDLGAEHAVEVFEMLPI